MKRTMTSGRLLFSRRVLAAGSAAAFSAALLAGWNAVGYAKQANGGLPAKPSAKNAPQSAPPAVSKTSPAAASEVGNGNLKLRDFVLDEATGIGTGHNFTYKTGDTVITGDNARYDKKTDMLDADSHLVMDDPQHHITGDKSHVERAKGLLLGNGNVVLTVKPDPAAPGGDDKGGDIGGAKKQGGVITCDNVESYYKKKFHTLRGHLVFKQHILRPGKPPLDRTVTAEHAVYDGKKEILTLFPPVLGEDSDGSKFHSDKNNVVVGTKAGSERLTGVQGEVSFPEPIEDKDTDDTPPPANPPATADTTKTDTNKSDKSDPGKPDTAKPDTLPTKPADTPKKNP